MKVYFISLLFFFFLPAYTEVRPMSDFSQVTENCAYAQEGSHTVQENSYRTLLLTLRGEKENQQTMPREREGGSGQR